MTESERERLEAIYTAKHSRAATGLTDNKGRLLAFLDYAPEHWTHLPTNDPTESTFGTVKAGAKKTRGAGSGMAGLAMAYKHIEAAEEGKRRIITPHLACPVLGGVRCKDGQRIGRGISVQPTAVPEQVAS